MNDDIKTTSDPKLDTPFPKHRIYYLVLKIAVLVVAAFFALRWLGAF